MAATDGARSRRRPWVLAATAVVVTAAVLLGLLAPDGSSKHSSAGDPIGPPGTTVDGHGVLGARPAAFALTPFASCDTALNGLRSHAAASVGPYGFGNGSIGMRYAEDVAAGAPVPQASGAGTTAGVNGSSTPGGPDVSSTNVQEKGVDEPDIVKADSQRVVTVTNAQLHVIDTGTRRLTGSLDLSIYAGADGAQLLVDGDHAVVILPSAVAYRYGMGVANGGAIYPNASNGNGTTVLFVDLTGQPAVTGTLRMAGGYLDARMVGGVVRLVQVSAPTIAFPMNVQSNEKANTARNRAIIEHAPISAWQPSYTLTTGTTTNTHTVPCGDISHPVKYTGASMVTVYTITPAHPSASPQPVTVAADGDTVYATATSLYVVSNATCQWCVTPTPQPTQIHRFDITGAGKPLYLGSGTVPGTLLSQYSLSDYAGHLRVAVTITTMRKVPVLVPDSGPIPGQPASTNSVYVLDDNTLRVTGHVDGLGRNEQIFAVRFLGATGYVVTYRQVDPLYVLDLADPSHPRSVAAVQLTGYSDYLHDVDSGRLLGVGQAVNDQSIVSGVQVSLFDVRTPSATRLTDRVKVPDTQDESRLDPHAFLYWAPTGLVVIPIQSWQPDQSGKALVLRVEGTRLVQVGLVANPQPVNAPDDGQGIQRSLIVGSSLWTLSSAGMKISSATSLAQQDFVSYG